VVSTKGVTLSVHILKVISDVHTTVTFMLHPLHNPLRMNNVTGVKCEQAVSALIAFAFYNYHKREFR